MLESIRIIGYKGFKDFKATFMNGVNVLVGDNETGKTTILEAINLVLSGQVFGRSIFSEVSPYMFNQENVQKFICSIGEKECRPPKIIIEATFVENDITSRYRGINNLDRVDIPGVSMVIDIDQAYAEEYVHYIEQKKDVTSVPTEFYGISWTFFSGNPVGLRGGEFKSTYIDSSTIRFATGSDRFINKVVNDTLTEKEKARLSIEYRKLRESFSRMDEVKTINDNLAIKGKLVTNKDFKVSVDISAKSGWDTVLIPYLDEIPFQFIGMGEQSRLKIGFALNSSMEKASIFLIEEPENHLSYSNMASLINRISEMCEGRQVIISTHSAFVLNKLGIDRLHLLRNCRITNLTKLDPSTVSYFKKLPGYDTLRMVLAKKIILVEGPTEELIVQRLYLDKYSHLPISDGIDIISVRGLAFKRFLEISRELNIPTSVITDNDGKPGKVIDKYKEFETIPEIKINFPNDEKITTLEIAIVECNNLDSLNKVFEKKYSSKNDIIEYMLANKTEWALKVFEYDSNIEYPEYIKNVV